MTSSIRTTLESMVAPDTLLPESELERFRTGPGEQGLPAAVLAPATEEELAALLARASEEGWRVLPAGLGLWLEGGGPAEVQLVVSTRRMKEIHEYNPPDLTFTAGAGLTLSALRGVTEPNGQWLPLNPPGGWEGSLGGALATGAGGSLRHLYGTARDHVLGLTLVAGDGRILRWGGKVVKNVAGFDVTRLCLGSWGSLGLITSVSARLFPIPEADATLVFRAPDAQALLPVARDMALSSLPLASVELVDALALEASDADHSAALVIRILGSREQATSMVARIRSELRREAGNPQVMENRESQALHRNMDSWEAGAALVLRMGALPSEMGNLLEEAEVLRGLTSGDFSPGGGVRFSAEVSTGVLRVAAFGDQGAMGSLASWTSALTDLRERLELAGGSLTISCGPADLMRDVGAWGTKGGEWEIMSGLKAEFDPVGILAPGRLGL
jgi:glycolate oxidase FAD binding subunit